jgi:hypothetical protein
MKTLLRFIFAAVVLSSVVGCTSTWDRADKYRDYVGKQFVTRYDCTLWKMVRHQYDLVPYKLDPVQSTNEPYGKKIAFIPAGTVVTVRDAKVRYSGGDWDFLLAELTLPETKERIVFEEMLGFSSVDPKELLKRWTPLK